MARLRSLSLIVHIYNYLKLTHRRYDYKS